MTIVVSAAVGPKIPGTVTLASTNGSSSNPTNSYTWSGQSLGAEHPARKLIALVRGVNANISQVGNLSGFSVAGIGMTIQQVAQFGWNWWALCTAALPTGITGDVVAQRNIGNGFDRCHWVLFAAYHIDSIVPTGFDAGGLTNANPSSRANVIGFRGIAVAAAYGGGTGIFTWSDAATKVSDIIVGVGAGERISGAVISKQQPAGTRAGTFTSTSSHDPAGIGGNHEQCAATFQ